MGVFLCFWRDKNAEQTYNEVTMKRSTSGHEVIEISDDDEPIDKKKPKIEAEDSYKVSASPIRLFKVADLPDSENQDAVTMASIIGKPDLNAMWQFNFCISIPFVMNNVHPDVRSKVKSYFVFGFTASRNHRDELKSDAKSCKHPENIKVDGVYLQNQYGTHHSKLMVLLFGDNDAEQTLQIVVHTANLIPFDWTNMTQGAWMSPRLKKKINGETTDKISIQFESDFLDYIQQYKTESTKKLALLLQQFDFSTIDKNVVFIASVPGNYSSDNPSYRKWGLCKLQKEMRKLSTSETHKTEIIAQVSSIATLGTTDTYIKHVVGNALLGKDFFSKQTGVFPTIIFPTVENVKESFYGYSSGSSIHFKRQSDAQLKQLHYMKPHLRQWGAIDAGRHRAAPHIKTYVKLIDDSHLGWILLTSANLSKQAWGNINEKKHNSQWIQSWECGVLIKPSSKRQYLIPTYKSDVANTKQIAQFLKSVKGKGPEDIEILSIRMPYDLPLVKYDGHDIIWSPNQTYSDKDWLGEQWPPVENQ